MKNKITFSIFMIVAFIAYQPSIFGMKKKYSFLTIIRLQARKAPLRLNAYLRVKHKLRQGVVNRSKKKITKRTSDKKTGKKIKKTNTSLDEIFAKEDDRDVVNFGTPRKKQKEKHTHT